MQTPVVFPYQQALDAFRREGREPPLLKRMSELISLLDLTTTLGSSLSGAEILDAALLIVMGELQVSRGGLFVRDSQGNLVRKASRGLAAAGDQGLDLGGPLGREPVVKGASAFRPQWSAQGFSVLCPVLRGQKAIAVLALGPRAGGKPYGPDEMTFLRSVAASASTPIENGLIYDELKTVNQRLSRKIFELNNLFDISRELTSSFDEGAIRSLFMATLMGQLMVSRAALYLAGPEGLRLAHERGVRGETEARVGEEEARAVLGALVRPRPVGELPDGKLRERLGRARLAFAFPLSVGERLAGFVAVSDRASGATFSEEDHDFVRTLGRQALAALESVRLHRVEVEKERQDREMQIAREIQQSLFPSGCPELPGFDLAARSEACYQVGGDHYDFIPLPDGRLALAVADVSGKGSPASILMASVHASLRALAGTAEPRQLMERLSRFLFESTQANRYVTLFYAELDPSARRLRYVNGGHVPPFHVSAEGQVERLTEGGPVLGLLEGVAYGEGEVDLAPGEVLAAVTDGATEATSSQGAEFGDEGMSEVLREGCHLDASALLEQVLARVHAWTEGRGCADDLTVLILKATTGKTPEP
jgi:phosphoserine phosphatase RsbU/P